MKRLVRYLQDQAVAASGRPLVHHENYAPEDSEPSPYILRRVEEDATKDGEVQPVFGLGDLAHVTTLDAHQAAANAVIAAGLEKHQYACDNILQGYDIYMPEPPLGITAEQETKRVWVIFIHGGYWCDPQQIAWTFTATRAMLLTNPFFKKAADHIAGYASINYRLSPHASFPQDRKKTSRYEMRDAKHPDRIKDVLAALHDLQKQHGFKERYLLCGHSCGATMAMQVAMGLRWTAAGPMPISKNVEADSPGGHVFPPLAILGIDGIYDMKLLRDTNRQVPMYQKFLEAAFGSNEEEWVASSPARWRKYAESWREGQLVILAHSRDDELVDWGQVEAMERCWRAGQQQDIDSGNAGEVTPVPAEMRLVEIQGKHAEIWQKGVGMASPIGEAVLLMVKDGDNKRNGE